MRGNAMNIFPGRLHLLRGASSLLLLVSLSLVACPRHQPRRDEPNRLELTVVDAEGSKISGARIRVARQKLGGQVEAQRYCTTMADAPCPFVSLLTDDEVPKEIGLELGTWYLVEIASPGHWFLWAEVRLDVSGQPVEFEVQLKSTELIDETGGVPFETRLSQGGAVRRGS